MGRKASISGTTGRFLGLLGLLVCVGGTTACFAPSALAASSTLAITVVTPVPEQAVPVQLTFSGTAVSTDSSGDSPSLYAAVRPAGGLPCQSTFEADQTAAGNASSLLTPSYGVNESVGQYQTSETFNPPAPGSYLVCAWLGSNGGTGAAGPISATVSARGPQVPQLSVSLPTAPKPNVAFQIAFTTQTDQQLTLFSTIKAAGGLPCASSFELEQQQNQSETTLLNSYGVSVFGGPTVTTASDTEKRGPFVICTWVEGPTSQEVDATLTTPIYVGTEIVPAPTPASPVIHLTHSKASRRHGVTVTGTTAAKLGGQLVVVASCSRAATSRRPSVHDGRFSTHLPFPNGCQRSARLRISVTWRGSKSFAYESVSTRAKISR